MYVYIYTNCIKNQAKPFFGLDGVSRPIIKLITALVGQNIKNLKIYRLVTNKFWFIIEYLIKNVYHDCACDKNI